MAEIKIRNLDKSLIYRIDELAKAKGMSREQYLRIQLELLAHSPLLRETEDKYQMLVQEVCDFIAYQTDKFCDIMSQEKEK